MAGACGVDVLDALCEQCRSIFLQEQAPEDEKFHLLHPDRKHLDVAAASGCIMCQVLLTEINSSSSAVPCGPNILGVSKWTITSELGDDDDPRTSSGLNANPMTASVNQVRFWLQPTRDVPAKSSSLAAGSTSSLLSLAIARGWLEMCKLHHNRCTPVAEASGFMPTRLVDLEVDRRNPSLVRIVETNHEHISGHYMTLSHRWGTVKFPMFSEANRARMLKGFSTAGLPQTFLDAIYVVRLFGIKYVWIDCLCIVQESSADFEREAGLMHQVYGNSQLNICATGAQNNQEPLFSTHEALPAQFPVQLKWHGSPATTFTLSNEELWHHSVFSRPVSKRAWVMQERFLAPRVLHFGSQQLLWECGELHACEQYPSGLPKAITFNTYDLKTIDSAREGDVDLSPELQVYKLWNELLTTYTSCGLTEPSDKLVALAGIATRVQVSLKSSYLAGLWQSYLVHDLLWQSEDIRSPVSRPVLYRAPSWSWASMDGPLIPGGQSAISLNARMSCSVLDAAVELASSSPFGPVKSASLLLQAKLKRMSIGSHLLSTPMKWHFSARSGRECGITVNGKLLRSISVAFDDAPDVPPTDSIWCFCVREEGQAEGIMRSGNIGREEQAFEPMWRCGLIVALSGPITGVYKRLGYFRLGGLEQLQIWEDARAADEHLWPCQEYDRDKHLHTFTLV